MRKIYRTFEERGVHVGFTARMLRLVRCRESREDQFKFEALVPNWSGSDVGQSGDMVMMWDQLPNWTDVLDRDRLLYDGLVQKCIELEGHLDPILMRDLRYEVDLQAGDDDIRHEAEYEIGLTRQDAQNSYLEILAMFGRQIGVATGNESFRKISGEILLTLADADPKELERLINIIANSVASGARMPRTELQQRLAVVSEYATPICSLVTDGVSKDVGFLSRQHARMERLMAEIADHIVGRPDEVSAGGSFACRNIQGFIDFANAKATEVKERVLDPRSYTTEKYYGELLDRITEQRKHIAYSLDGWEVHAKAWERLGDDEPLERSTLLRKMIADMPGQPHEIEDVTDGRDNNLFNSQIQGRIVKEMHSWIDGELDEELAERVLRAKEKEAENDPRPIRSTQPHLRRRRKLVPSTAVKWQSKLG